METNKSVKVVKPSKPISQSPPVKHPTEIKPEIPPIKKSAWEILPARCYPPNLKPGR